jgi:hypothetical protein
MSNGKISSSLHLLFLRLFFAWMVGGALYFATLVFTDYDGFNTFVTGIIGGAIISAICVVGCAITGLLLLIPFIKRFWRASFIPAFAFCVLGFLLFIFGLLPSQVKTVGHDENGGSIKEVGMTWTPGCLLLIFAIANFPYLPKSNSKDSQQTGALK